MFSSCMYIAPINQPRHGAQNKNHMNQATRDNIDVAILSGRMTSVEAYNAVSHPESKAYIVKEHMDEELELYLGL